jgi:hypothetical protein
MAAYSDMKLSPSQWAEEYEQRNPNGVQVPAAAGAEPDQANPEDKTTPAPGAAASAGKRPLRIQFEHDAKGAIVSATPLYAN